MQIWRYLFAGLAWLFVVALIVQVFLAGIGLFGVSDLELHRGVGYNLPIVPLLMLLLAWPARVERRTVWLALALFVVTMIQTVLPSLRGSVPLIAALHPVNALLVFYLSVVVARRSVPLVRRAPAPVMGTPEAAPERA
jgi:mercuric ion transport protein